MTLAIVVFGYWRMCVLQLQTVICARFMRR